jgi:hypothetical protein
MFHHRTKENPQPGHLGTFCRPLQSLWHSRQWSPVQTAWNLQSPWEHHQPCQTPTWRFRSQTQDRHEESHEIPYGKGVKQGGIMAPILFLFLMLAFSAGDTWRRIWQGMGYKTNWVQVPCRHHKGATKIPNSAMLSTYLPYCSTPICWWHLLPLCNKRWPHPRHQLNLPPIQMFRPTDAHW